MELTVTDLEDVEILGARENLLKDHILNLYNAAGQISGFGTETYTGKTWIDGKAIYRQTFTMNNPGIGDITFPHGIPGLDLIISGIEGYCTLANGTKSPLPIINHESGGGGGGSGGGGGDSGNTITIIEWDDTNILGYIGSNYVLAVAVATLVFTIEYTKVEI